ncbi:MAG: Crp/Fnr family transcriptional regulator [Prevotella sp.]|jgi:CRP-like cAMP-binding protein|nr:Crp/Fnr family transcriptional regulator [Prevotella sp.]MCH4019051.1 Crp/Fnr family transcriptional regulator [Prevotella sp.]MCH4099356.1 Crp/Fnr family transcriptional regulator [Prevotella sp.]
MEEKIRTALMSCPLFAQMDGKEIESVMENVNYKTVEFSKGEIIALAGIPCRYADIVVGGSLICSMASLSGKQIEISRLSRGNMIAPAYLFSQDHAMPVSVETDTKAEILRMSKESFRTLADSNRQVRMNFIRLLSDLNVFLTGKIKILSLYTVREKVAYLIRKIADEQDSNLIHLDRSRQEIAKSFGIQKFSLLRVLSHFEQEGAIKIDGKDIQIINSKLIR